MSLAFCFFSSVIRTPLSLSRLVAGCCRRHGLVIYAAYPFVLLGCGSFFSSLGFVVLGLVCCFQDLLANAEFIRLADAIVEVPAGKNSNNYANVDLIVDTAIKQVLCVCVCVCVVFVAIFRADRLTNEKTSVVAGMKSVGGAKVEAAGT